MSLYTDPRKFRGMESWNTRPFIITKSPTVNVPETTPWLAMTMSVVSAMVKVALCPKLSRERLVVVFSAPFS
jgi:hypothetical protein